MVKKNEASVKVVESLSTKNYQVTKIPCKKIASNRMNPRASLPMLDACGYGIFERKQDSDKPALMEMAFSDNPDHRAEFLNLIQSIESKGDEGPVTHDEKAEHKGSIPQLAADLAIHGWVHAGEVRPLPDGTFDLILGARRTVAAVYNAILHGIEPVGFYKIIDVDDNEAQARAFSENFHRRDMKPVEQAKIFNKMRAMGLDIKTISEKTGIDHQTVRGRLSLLGKHLTDKDRDNIDKGDLPYHKALQIIKRKKDGGDESKPSNPNLNRNANKEGRRTAPTLKEFERWYNDRENLHEEVRKFIALEILKQPYQTFKEMRKQVEAATERQK